MAKPQHDKVLRLRRRHGDGSQRTVTADDGRRLVQRQSERAAIMAGLIVIIVFCLLWVMVTDLFDTVYPWATVILGYLVGHAVSRAGKGVDWWFALIAALLTLFGSVLANVVVAASVSADELSSTTLAVLQDVSTTTWPIFFGVIWNIGDTAFAVFAAALAAFYSMRRLDRDEYYALRLWREEQEGE
ncbi:MAG: hypothetical protein AAFN50_13180 [Pseudomonadota bacterium]